MKQLSEKLSDLSIKAKKAEESFAASKHEAQERLAVRREAVRASSQAAIKRVQDKVNSARDQADERWNAFKTKLAADSETLHDSFQQKRLERKARSTGNYAADMAVEAGAAIDYAVATIDMAELAVLDAVAAQDEADIAKVRQPTHA